MVKSNRVMPKPDTIPQKAINQGKNLNPTNVTTAPNNTSPIPNMIVYFSMNLRKAPASNTGHPAALITFTFGLHVSVALNT